MYLKIAISSEYSLWISTLCLAFGLAISWWLYVKGKDMSEVRKEIKYFLFALRTTYISILAFLLISPFLLYLDPIVEKPILIFGQDKSQSVEFLNDTTQINEYKEERRAFIEKCKENFDIHSYGFGESVSEDTGDLIFDQRLTDISVFLKEIEDRYENRNVASMILASDGLYNRGENPIYTSAVISFPIVCLALGDTIPRKDLWIDQVHHNKLAFLGNTFDVKISFGASLLNGQKSRLVIKKGSKVYHSKIVSFDKDEVNQEHLFALPADELGLLRFEAEILPLEEEVSKENNRRYFYVDVLEGHQKVLIVSAAPHPDISALLSALNSSKNFRAKSVLAEEFEGIDDGYNLLILNGLPSNIMNGQLVKLLESPLPKLFIIGQTTSMESFNKLEVGLTITKFKGRFSEAVPIVNPDFQYFSLGETNKKQIEQFPPLNSILASFELDGRANSLFYQKIGKVATNYPMTVFIEKEGVKNGVITGEGLWRWRLYDYRLNGSTLVFDELIQKTIQYLSLQLDKSRFRLDIEPSYFENNSVIINAEYYNKSYELNNEDEAEFVLRSEGNETFEYNFLRVNNLYRIDLGKLKPGEYNWKATLNDGNNKFEKSGSFRVKPLQLEQNMLNADYGLLYNLSQKYGGKMIYPADLNQYADELLQDGRFKPVIHYSEKMKELISFKWLFFILLVLFSTEWMVRKWMGLN